MWVVYAELLTLPHKNILKVVTPVRAEWLVHLGKKCFRIDGLDPDGAASLERITTETEKDRSLQRDVREANSLAGPVAAATLASSGGGCGGPSTMSGFASFQRPPVQLVRVSEREPEPGLAAERGQGGPTEATMWRGSRGPCNTA